MRKHILHPRKVFSHGIHCGQTGQSGDKISGVSDTIFLLRSLRIKNSPCRKSPDKGCFLSFLKEENLMVFLHLLDQNLLGFVLPKPFELGGGAAQPFFEHLAEVVGLRES